MIGYALLLHPNPFDHLLPPPRHAFIGGHVRLLQWNIDIVAGVEKERHRHKRLADGRRLNVARDCRGGAPIGDVGGKRQSLVRRQLIVVSSSKSVSVVSDDARVSTSG